MAEELDESRAPAAMDTGDPDAAEADAAEGAGGSAEGAAAEDAGEADRADEAAAPAAEGSRAAAGGAALSEAAVVEAAKACLETDEELRDELQNGSLTLNMVLVAVAARLGLGLAKELKPFKPAIREMMLANAEPPKKKERASESAEEDEEEEEGEEDGGGEDEVPHADDAKFAALPSSWTSQFGDVAWVAQPPFKHWPGIIYDPRWTTGEVNGVGMTKLGVDHLCMFFATDVNERFAPVPPENIVEWEAGLAKGFGKHAKSFKPKKYEVNFPKAIKEATEEFALPVSQRGKKYHSVKPKSSASKKPPKRAADDDDDEPDAAQDDDDDDAGGKDDDDDDEEVDDDEVVKKPKKKRLRQGDAAPKALKAPKPPKAASEARDAKRKEAASAAGAADVRQRKMAAARASGVPVWKQLQGGGGKEIAAALSGLRAAVAADAAVDTTAQLAALLREPLLSRVAAGLNSDDADASTALLAVVKQLKKKFGDATEPEAKALGDAAKQLIKELKTKYAALAAAPPAEPSPPPQAPRAAPSAKAAAPAAPAAVRRLPPPPAQKPRPPPPSQPPSQPTDILAAAFGR
ncbi:hypothetical protein M885DRAFT_548508 [Pelagophyceae sp. CCMP2097]|nr:hypothetical protein M885DRAFT_548508 [Pelagophyceae sp. CCMP2097]